MEPKKHRTAQKHRKLQETQPHSKESERYKYNSKGPEEPEEPEDERYTYNPNGPKQNQIPEDNQASSEIQQVSVRPKSNPTEDIKQPSKNKVNVKQLGDNLGINLSKWLIP